ncbi:hypothetical protein BDP27DRAFT_1449361 [Rhodocollybia butyracea]|uniref:DUF6533 domain-containing protein n=1 Tax=Rhodocollybia butyracea TaxID=206335 RepID=A0A9P5U5I9_9AGAR|nr:hypothetical protein BDP27DRAFT_1449361 [Rhodocollybia butyracea]
MLSTFPPPDCRLPPRSVTPLQFPLTSQSPSHRAIRQLNIHPPESDNTVTNSDTRFSPSSNPSSSPSCSPGRSLSPSHSRSSSPSCSPGPTPGLVPYYSSTSPAPSPPMPQGLTPHPYPNVNLHSLKLSPLGLHIHHSGHAPRHDPAIRDVNPGTNTKSLYCRRFAVHSKSGLLTDSDMNLDMDSNMNSEARPQRYNIQIDVDIGRTRWISRKWSSDTLMIGAFYRYFALLYSAQNLNATFGVLFEYFLVSSIVLFLYDWILMLPVELDVVWSEKLRPLNVLYIIQRYMPFLDTVASIIFAGKDQSLDKI